MSESVNVRMARDLTVAPAPPPVHPSSHGHSHEHHEHGEHGDSSDDNNHYGYWDEILNEIKEKTIYFQDSTMCHEYNSNTTRFKLQYPLSYSFIEL